MISPVVSPARSNHRTCRACCSCNRDLLGFRGALCAGDRASTLDPARIALIRGLIPAELPDGDRAAQLHILGTRGFVPDPASTLHTDRIFVREFVLPVHIGAYAREHGTPQRVRFDVDAWVAHATGPARDLCHQDLRDVVSYDLISDSIRLLVDSGHVELAETLAEQIAATLLAHPRIVKVRVRLEKLETGAGIAGVELERTRETMRAAAAEPMMARF